MGAVWSILAVPIPIMYTTFTCWVPGAESSAVKRVSSPFRYCGSLPRVFRKLKMSLALFLCVYGSILLIEVETILGTLVEYCVLWLIFPCLWK